jgi:hypothetical protein
VRFAERFAQCASRRLRHQASRPPHTSRLRTRCLSISCRLLALQSNLLVVSCSFLLRKQPATRTAKIERLPVVSHCSLLWVPHTKDSMAATAHTLEFRPRSGRFRAPQAKIFVKWSFSRENGRENGKKKFRGTRENFAVPRPLRGGATRQFRLGEASPQEEVFIPTRSFQHLIASPTSR